MKRSIKNIVLIAGGIGGAKLAEGLHSIKDINLAIIGNIADDDEFHGLRVSPDIDTLTYTLSGMVNRKQGWGVKNDNYKTLSMLCLLYTSPSPRDRTRSRMPSSA